jgi:MFS family permease
MDTLQRKLHSSRIVLLTILFLLAFISAMLFQFIQVPDVFHPEKFSDFSKLVKRLIMITLFASAVVAAMCNQLFARLFGIKKVLLLSFLFHLLALIFLTPIHLGLGTFAESRLFAFVGMFFLGFAVTTILISLNTYVIIKMPGKVTFGILMLSVFANIGAFVSPLLFRLFGHFDMEWLFILFFFLLILGSIFVVARFLCDLPFPKHLVHLRKGTLIWKELHVRLLLFVFIVLFYTFCENTFNVWGLIYLFNFFEINPANEFISMFWFFLIIGQIIVVYLARKIDFRKIYYLLAMLMIVALIILSYKPQANWTIAALIIGGLGCSACFPLVLVMLEKELIYLTKVYRRLFYLPYLEYGIAIMIGSYYLGNSIYYTMLVGVDQFFLSLPSLYFKIGVFLGLTMLAIIIFLSYTSCYKKKTLKY